MKIPYINKRISAARLEVIRQANEILNEYAAQGFTLTLRQLYYQFVSRALIPNSDREYKKLGDVVVDARMTGRMSWRLIIDRTRSLRSLATWDDPADRIASAVETHRNDKWGDQPYRCEVWIEKDALVGVIAGICNELQVPYFSCRGYTSISAAWQAAQRLGRHLQDDKHVKIIHLGDHDPSGIDMTRDIEDRLRRFLVQDYFNENGCTEDEAVSYVDDHFEVIRVALTMAQIQQYNPPPNPAKMSDSRAEDYVAEFGNQSWELDALEPRVIAELIEAEVLNWRDDSLWDDAVAEEDRQVTLLQQPRPAGPRSKSS